MQWDGCLTNNTKLKFVQINIESLLLITGLPTNKHNRKQQNRMNKQTKNIKSSDLKKQMCLMPYFCHMHTRIPPYSTTNKLGLYLLPGKIQDLIHWSRRTTKSKNSTLFKQEPEEMSVWFSTKALKSNRTSSPLHNYTAKIDKQTIKTENIHSTEALTCRSAGLTKIKLHEAIREMCTFIKDSITP